MMTLKQIAETAGCSYRVVLAATKETLPGLVKNGQATELTEGEALMVIAKVPKRNLVSPITKVQGRERFPMAEFQAIVESAVRGALAAFRAESQPSPAPAQIEAPKMTDRAELRQIVAKYAKAHGGDYSDAWGIVYGAAYYRLKINLRVRSERSGKAPIEVAEEAGLLPEIIAIAREVLG